MPIYEYLCPSCNRVFNFLVKSSRTEKEAVCPKCGGTNMRKRVSRFAVTGVERKSTKNAPASADNPEGADALDDPRVEREMMKLMSDAESIDENDPRQLGKLMRRMTEIAGEPVEPEMEEAMRRLEAGEDPEKIEEELGDFLGDDEEGGAGGGGAPSYDDGLYEL